MNSGTVRVHGGSSVCSILSLNSRPWTSKHVWNRRDRGENRQNLCAVKKDDGGRSVSKLYIFVRVHGKQ
jgi:hypothetical protein